MIGVEKQDPALVRLLMGLATHPEDQKRMLSAKVRNVILNCN